MLNCMNVAQFIHYLMGLGMFLTIMNNTAVNIHVQIFVLTVVFKLSDIYVRGIAKSYTKVLKN